MKIFCGLLCILKNWKELFKMVFFFFANSFIVQKELSQWFCRSDPRDKKKIPIFFHIHKLKKKNSVFAISVFCVLIKKLSYTILLYKLLYREEITIIPIDSRDLRPEILKRTECSE